MNEYRRWLTSQLNQLDGEFDESIADGLRMMIVESSRRAAAAGLPDAVKACQIRAGGISPSLAREILAECLACIVDDRPTLTPPQLADEWGVSPDKVRAWIRSGELKARNVSQGTRPRYVIDRSDIESFRQRDKPAPRPRRQRTDPDIIEFYR